VKYLNTRYIFEFTQIVHYGSFSEAANELFISQSSLSKRIQSLEEHLGILLFDRSSRKVSLTPAGTAFLHFAKIICDAEYNALRVLREFGAAEDRKLTIVGLVTMSFYGVLTDVAKFQQLHPEINVKITEYNRIDVVKGLEKGEFDLAFHDGSLFTDSEGIDTIHYSDDYLVAAVHKDHYLAKEDIIDVRRLSNEKLIFIDKTSPLHNISYKLCQDVGFAPNVYFTGVRLENIFELVSLNMGIAFLAKKCTVLNKHDSVCIKELSPTVTRKVVLARSKNKELSDEADEFWNYIAALSEYRHKIKTQNLKAPL